MDFLPIALTALAGALVAGLLVWVVLKGRQSGLKEEKIRLQTMLEGMKSLEAAREELKTTFQSLSFDALEKSNKAFIEMAKASLEKIQVQTVGDLEKRQQSIQHLVVPIRESLDKVTTEINQLEKTRQEAYGALKEQVTSLLGAQKELRTETQNLVQALRRPSVRGRWGEIQLRRVVELAGMLNYCDFEEQRTVQAEEGRLRPDLIVRLPGEKVVVVDAKAPLEGYLNALEAKTNEDRLRQLKVHARHIREHLRNLSEKGYWEQFDQAPEFVVMFLPGESFFSAALQEDPSLIEAGVNQGVILATPTTLIALLKSVAYGWQQAKVAESAQAIWNLGKELHDRLRVMVEHFARVGAGLDRAVEAYNRAAASFESRVLVSARKINEMGTGSLKEIPTPEPIEKLPRQLEEPGTREMEPPESESLKP